MSSRKGKRIRPEAEHLKTAGQLLVTQVTPYSFWFDSWWYADNPVGGAKGVSINWFRNFTIDESKDPRCLKLVDDARRLVYAMLHSSSLKQRSVETVYCSYARKLLQLVTWMYDNKVWRFADITPEVADRYKSDLIEAGPALEEGGDDLLESLNPSDLRTEELSVSTLSIHFRVLIIIYELAGEFEPFPDLCIPEHPFRGRSAKSLAESLSVAADGWIPRVPDEVLNPLMQTALEWVDVYSTDILIAQQAYFDALDGRPEYKGKNHQNFTTPHLRDVVFNGGGTLQEEWRPPLVTRDRLPLAGPTIQLRKLINDLEASSAICVQAVTGIRVSEFLAARVEPRQSNGWPACLVQKASSSGLYDLFYFASWIFKGREVEGTRMEWLIGVRPAGASYLPIAARAIIVLDKLFQPWRSLFDTDYLTLSLGAGNGLPKVKPAQTKPLDSRLASVSKEFIQQHVTFPEEYAQWVVTTHQYRKAFCQDIIRINPKALTAVQEHYGHASQYITDEAYAGNDTRMLRLIDDVATREAARIMVDRIYSGAPLAGKLAPILDSRKEAIKALLGSEVTEERRITALANALSVEGIKLFTSDYIDCFFRGEHAMCHREALGSFDSEAIRPLRAYRTKKNCSVCANGLINRHHVSYWIQDYRLNENIRKANENLGDHRVAAVASARAAQARSVLKRFGAWPIPGGS